MNDCDKCKLIAEQIHMNSLSINGEDYIEDMPYLIHFLSYLCHKHSPECRKLQVSDRRKFTVKSPISD